MLDSTTGRTHFQQSISKLPTHLQNPSYQPCTIACSFHRLTDLFLETTFFYLHSSAWPEARHCRVSAASM